MHSVFGPPAESEISNRPGPLMAAVWCGPGKKTQGSFRNCPQKSRLHFTLRGSEWGHSSWHWPPSGRTGCSVGAWGRLTGIHLHFSMNKLVIALF